MTGCKIQITNRCAIELAFIGALRVRPMRSEIGTAAPTVQFGCVFMLFVYIYFNRFVLATAILSS